MSDIELQNSRNKIWKDAASKLFGYVHIDCDQVTVFDRHARNHGIVLQFDIPNVRYLPIDLTVDDD